MAAAWPVAALALLLAPLFFWSFRHLPEERWQVLAAVPWRARGHGRFRALNLTWYGVFNATGAALGAAVLVLLLGAAGAGGLEVALVGGGVFAAGFWGSRLVARWVEGKKHTASLGAGVFCSVLAVPLVLWRLTATGLGTSAVTPLAALAATSVAYCLGEGVGRLACLSFGCCYGRAVVELPPLERRIFGGFPLVFRGASKKIAYASGLAGVEVVPVQAWTSVVLSSLALLGMWTLLQGWVASAFVLTLGLSQLWRLYSERLRADHRGGGRLTAYQWMALTLVPGSFVAGLWFGASQAAAPDLGAGLALLARPATLLALQAVWLTVFALTGLSSVTGSLLSLRVYRSRI